MAVSLKADAGSAYRRPSLIAMKTAPPPGSKAQSPGLFKRLTHLAMGGSAMEGPISMKTLNEVVAASASSSPAADQAVHLQALAEGQILTVQYAAYSHAGADGGAGLKENQDTWVVHEGLSGGANALFCVFDGHGVEGERCSRHVASHLPSLLVHSAHFKARRYAEAFQEQFLACNQALLKQRSINCSLSGSTGVVAFLQDKGRLLVAGVGDSRCMLGRLQPDGAVRAVPLSIDHTPENPTEASRVRLHGGRLEPYRIGYEEMGPCRVWLADSDTPGLSMTRAFGDAVAATVGIIAQPDVMQVVLQPEDCYMVLCSDGIYEFMANDEIMALVHERAQQGSQPSDIAQHLVRTARSQWLAEEEGGIDDCTAIVCILQQGGRARRTGSVLPTDAAKAATAISRRMSGTPQVVAAQEPIAIVANATTRRAARGTMVGPAALGSARLMPSSPVGSQKSNTRSKPTVAATEQVQQRVAGDSALRKTRSFRASDDRSLV